MYDKGKTIILNIGRHLMRQFKSRGEHIDNDFQLHYCPSNAMLRKGRKAYSFAKNR